jgi:hypothetical protein
MGSLVSSLKILSVSYAQLRTQHLIPFSDIQNNFDIFPIAIKSLSSYSFQISTTMHVASLSKAQTFPEPYLT